MNQWLAKCDLQERFVEAMRELYPAGVTDKQLGDLVRIFISGWLESMHCMRNAIGDLEALYSLLGAVGMKFVHTTVPDWIPDDSWKWWDPATARGPATTPKQFPPPDSLVGIAVVSSTGTACILSLGNSTNVNEHPSFIIRKELSLRIAAELFRRASTLNHDDRVTCFTSMAKLSKEQLAGRSPLEESPP